MSPKITFLFILFPLLLLFAINAVLGPDNSAQVALQAAPRSDGKAYLYETLSLGDAGHIVFPDNTQCTRVDDAWYKLGSGETAIYFYKLNCGGTIGYANRDLVR